MSPIKGLSEVRRLPRLGKIRLGEKALSKKSGKEYPTETPHFVVPSEVAEVFGKKPTKLDVMFPAGTLEEIFPQWYKQYGSSSMLKCKGDGEQASKVNDKGGFEEIPCLGEECPHRKDNSCNRVGVLNILLPKVPGLGVYQIVTSSVNSIKNINNSLRILGKAMSGVPLTLERKEEAIQHEGKKTKHYILSINMDFKLEDIMSKRIALPGPADVGLPLPDAGQPEDISTTIPEDQGNGKQAPKEEESKGEGSDPLEGTKKEREEVQRKLDEALDTKITFGTQHDKTFRQVCEGESVNQAKRYLQALAHKTRTDGVPDREKAKKAAERILWTIGEGFYELAGPK